MALGIDDRPSQECHVIVDQPAHGLRCHIEFLILNSKYRSSAYVLERTSLGMTVELELMVEGCRHGEVGESRVIELIA